MSGNPLAMVAGIKTLEILDRPGAYEGMTEKTKRLTDGLLQAGRDAGHEVTGGCISGERLTCCGQISCFVLLYFITGVGHIWSSS